MDEYDEFGNLIKSCIIKKTEEIEIITHEKDELSLKESMFKYVEQEETQEYEVQNLNYFLELAKLRNRISNVGVFGSLKCGKSELIKHFAELSHLKTKTNNEINNYEAERNITLHFKPYTMLLSNSKGQSRIINFFDTSAHADFFYETRSLVSKVEICILILNINEDFNIITEKLLKEIKKLDKPIILIFNKIDLFYDEYNEFTNFNIMRKIEKIKILISFINKIMEMKIKITDNNVFFSSFKDKWIINIDAIYSLEIGREPNIDTVAKYVFEPILKIYYLKKMKLFDKFANKCFIVDEFEKRKIIYNKRLEFLKGYKIKKETGFLAFCEEEIELERHASNIKKKDMDFEDIIGDILDAKRELEKVRKIMIFIYGGYVEVQKPIPGIPCLLFLSSKLEDFKKPRREFNCIKVKFQFSKNNNFDSNEFSLIYPSLDIGINEICGNGELILDCALYDIKNLYDPDLVIIGVCSRYKESVNSSSIYFNGYVEVQCSSMASGNELFKEGTNVLEELFLNEDQDKILLKNAELQIKNGFKSAVNCGPIMGEEMEHTYFKMTVLKPDISTSLFIEACHSAFLDSKPKILEALSSVEVLYAEEDEKIVNKILNERGVKIFNKERNFLNGLKKIRGIISSFECFGFETDIRFNTLKESMVYVIFDKWNVVEGNPLDGNEKNNLANILKHKILKFKENLE